MFKNGTSMRTKLKHKPIILSKFFVLFNYGYFLPLKHVGRKQLVIWWEYNILGHISKESFYQAPRFSFLFSIYLSDSQFLVHLITQTSPFLPTASKHKEWLIKFSKSHVFTKNLYQILTLTALLLCTRFSLESLSKWIVHC